MKKLAFLLVLSFLLSNIVFGQFGRTSEMIITDNAFDKHNEMLSTFLEKNNDELEFWQLDSIITYHIEESDSTKYMKSIYIRDNANNKLIFILLQKPLSGNYWNNKSKSELTLNDDGLQILSLYYQGDEQEWVLTSKLSNDYDDNGQMLHSTRYIWDIDNELWLNNSKFEYQYDNQNLNTTVIQYTTDYETNIWKNYQKKQILINSLGQEVEQTTLLWNSDSSIWVNSELITYFYENNLKSDIQYWWDAYEWRLLSKNDVYEIGLNIVVHDGFYYKNDSAWVHNRKKRFEYNDDGNTLLEESYGFVEEDSMWVGYTKYVSIYNLSGQRTVQIKYAWNNDINNWRFLHKNTFEYNEQGLVFFNSSFGWFELENIWNRDWSNIYYYSNPSSIYNNNMVNLSINISPNPSTYQISINYDASSYQNVVYSIFTISGKVVDEGLIPQSNTINVSKLDAGYYLIKLEVGVKRYSGKFLKL